MDLSDPFAAYNARSLDEARHVCDLLAHAGLAAIIVADVAEMDVPVGGLAPIDGQPQVWVERATFHQARPVLEQYAQFKAAEQPTDAVEAPIEIVCEACGETCEFPASLKGTIQDCPHCFAYVDVEDDPIFGEWGDDPDAEPDAVSGDEDEDEDKS